MWERPKRRLCWWWCIARAPPARKLLRDRRGKSETVFGAVLSEAGSALLISLVAAFFLSWKFGWLRRRPA